MGDFNSGGGQITTIPQSNVYCNNKLVAIDGSTGTTHGPNFSKHNHGAWQTRSGSRTVYVNGRGISLTGDSDTCGHQRVGGSSNCFSG